MLTDEQRRFVEAQRVGHLATADERARPHVMPVCFALAERDVYVTIDEKPKRDATKPLRRVRNIQANPTAALIVDSYDEDWTRLGWIMLRGRAEIIESGPEHRRAQQMLRERYPQLAAMQIERLPVIAIRIGKVNAWGNLGASTSTAG